MSIVIAARIDRLEKKLRSAEQRITQMEELLLLPVEKEVARIAQEQLGGRQARVIHEVRGRGKGGYSAIISLADELTTKEMAESLAADHNARLEGGLV